MGDFRDFSNFEYFFWSRATDSGPANRFLECSWVVWKGFVVKSRVPAGEIDFWYLWTMLTSQNPNTAARADLGAAGRGKKCRKVPKIDFRGLGNSVSSADLPVWRGQLP